MRIERGVLVAMLTFAAAPLQAQQPDWQLGDQTWCEEGRGRRGGEDLCEVRATTVAANGSVDVDGRDNGGVRVEAWDGDAIAVSARVDVRARSDERAREIADEVEVTWEDGRLSADGPRTGRRESWVVSYRLSVPRNTDLRVRTTNGGIDVDGVVGDIDVRAVNGGVSFTGLAGDVRGRTTNGGLSVELADSRWDGEGLDVETTNGGVTLTMPDDYSADLELGTTNGRIDLDFPVTVQGRLGRHLEASLGEGGPTIRAVTTNGSVRVSRR